MSNTRQLSCTQKQRKTTFSIIRKFEKLQSTKQSQIVVCRFGRACKTSFRFPLFYRLIQGWSKILVSSIHSGWDERRMEDYPPKLFQIKKKPRKKVFCQKLRTVVALILHLKIVFSHKERNYKLFVCASK